MESGVTTSGPGEGAADGTALGADDGGADGTDDGAADGCGLGEEVETGEGVGTDVGVAIGAGLFDGFGLGDAGATDTGVLPDAPGASGENAPPPLQPVTRMIARTAAVSRMLGGLMRDFISGPRVC